MRIGLSHLKSLPGASALVYGFVFYNCLFLCFFYHTYFAADSLWPLSSQLETHFWRDWAGVFWQHSWLLFVAAMLAAALGLVRPSWKISLSLAFLMALIFQRNVWITDSGDKLLVILLVWHALLLSAQEKSLHWVKHLFTAQLALIYVQNGISKINPLWLDSATALNLIWSYPGSAFTWMESISRLELAWLSRVLPFLEIILAGFLYSRFRRKVACAFITYHLLTSATLNIGFFSPIMLLWWGVFLSLDKDFGPPRRSWNFPAILAAIWMATIVVQTVFQIFSIRLNRELEWRMAISYLKQSWTMFADPRNRIPRYRIECFSAERPIPCSNEVLHWTQRERWDKRELGMMDKLATRSLPGLARRNFHQHLCSLQPEATAIDVSLQIEVKDLDDPSRRYFEKKNFGVDSRCRRENGPQEPGPVKITE